VTTSAAVQETVPAAESKAPTAVSEVTEDAAETAEATEAAEAAEAAKAAKAAKVKSAEEAKAAKAKAAEDAKAARAAAKEAAKLAKPKQAAPPAPSAPSASPSGGVISWLGGVLDDAAAKKPPQKAVDAPATKVSTRAPANALLVLGVPLVVLLALAPYLFTQLGFKPF